MWNKLSASECEDDGFELEYESNVSSESKSESESDASLAREELPVLGFSWL